MKWLDHGAQRDYEALTRELEQLASRLGFDRPPDDGDGSSGMFTNAEYSGPRDEFTRRWDEWRKDSAPLFLERFQLYCKYCRH